MSKRLFILLVVLVLAASVAPVSAQDAPSVTVSDQVILNNIAWVTSAYSAGPGFIVVHIDDGTGKPGPVAGFRSINAGWNYNIGITIDPTIATPTMFAMLHEDTGTVGLYEFGSVEGADVPVVANGAVVTPPFKAELITPDDQFVVGDTVTIGNVVTNAPGWLVIHAGDAQNFGAVLGQTQVQAGNNANVVVTLAAQGRTDILWPMIHVDTGTPGVYEFGAVEGADAPVVVNGAIASTPIWTVPHIRVYDQIVLPGGDASGNRPIGEATLRVASALAQGPGFVVIHQEQNGTFGPVAGLIPVPDGVSKNLIISLDPTLVTPRLWPMLHVDTGALGVYEFGAVEGADVPVFVNGEIVSFPIEAAPSQVFADQAISAENTITIDKALIDQHGWIAIHQNNNDQPGPVITVYPIIRGVNTNIVIPVDPAAAGSKVFPMLHYDNGALGQYEFAGLEAGLDLPVFLNQQVVVAPMNLGGGTGGAPAVDCTLAPAAGQNINIRAAASTNSQVVGTLSAGTVTNADGKTSDGAYTWYRLTQGGWVRGDVVTISDGCVGLPTIEGAVPAAPAADQPAPAQPTAAPPPPAATPEV